MLCFFSLPEAEDRERVDQWKGAQNAGKKIPKRHAIHASVLVQKHNQNSEGLAQNLFQKKTTTTTALAVPPGTLHATPPPRRQEQNPSFLHFFRGGFG